MSVKEAFTSFSITSISLCTISLIVSVVKGDKEVGVREGAEHD